MGGGKGGGQQPPSQGFDTTQQQASLMQQMASLAALQQQSAMMAQQAAAQVPAFPEIPQAPDPIKSPEADWQARREELANKIKADYAISKTKRKGRQDTIATSPLLDNEEASTTNPNSLLTTNSSL